MVIQVLISSKSQTCALLVWQILLGSMESDGFRTLYLTVLLASQPRKHLITSIYQIIGGIIVPIGCDDTNHTACPQTL